MTTQLRDIRKGERGNALFLILIAVALFAALSYAVTQSGRGSGSIDREQSVINAGQLTQFPSSVRTAVTRMVLTGTAATAVDYETTATGSAAVFDAAGGGAIVQSPPGSSVSGNAASTGAEADASVDWRFKAVTTTAAGGWFIDDIGSDTDTGGRDSFAFLGVTDATCDAINNGLDVTLFAQGATATNFAGTAGTEGDPANQDGGTTATTDDAGANAHSIDAAGEAFACYSNAATANAGDPKVYYHALIER